MIKFIREHTDIIIKFMLTHVVMSILGIMVGLSVMSIEGETESMSAIAIIGSVFTIGFMCFMHYDDMFFFAAKEGIRLRNDNERPDMLRGLKITLVAYAPVLVVGLAWVIIDLFASDVENLSGITMLVYYFMQGSFLALYKVRELLGATAYVIITLLPAIIASALGYIVGVKDKSLRGMMGFNVKPPYDGPLERKPKKNDTNE